MRRALLLRGHHTQGAYTHLTDETNQPEPQPEDPIPAAAEETNAADPPAEMTAAPQADEPADAIVDEAPAEPESEPEPAAPEPASRAEPGGVANSNTGTVNGNVVQAGIINVRGNWNQNHGQHP